MIYLDSAATSLIKPARVEQAVLNSMRTMSSPGRGSYLPAMKAAEMVYECRNAVSELFGVKAAESVVITMNATHALNIAIKSLAKPGMKVLISGFEHNSVLRPLVAMEAEIVVCGRTLFDPDEVYNEFEKNIADAGLVVCTHVSNVFGFILPVKRLASLCKRNGVPFILDASQSAGVLDIDFDGLGASFAAFPGHKSLLGPQGTGVLLCAAECRPLMEGGSGTDSASPYMPEYLPDRLEAGTHNVSGIAGLYAGITYVIEKGTERILEHERQMLDFVCSQLNEDSLELFVAKKREDQCGVLSLRHRKKGCEEMASILSDAGICVRSGLHCAPLAHESAGTDESGTVRLSFSPFVSETQLQYVCRILNGI